MKKVVGLILIALIIFGAMVNLLESIVLGKTDWAK